MAKARKKSYKSQNRDNTPKMMDLAPSESANKGKIKTKRGKRAVTEAATKLGDVESINNDVPRRFRQIMIHARKSKHIGTKIGNNTNSQENTGKMDVVGKGKKISSNLKPDDTSLHRKKNESMRDLMHRIDNDHRVEFITAAKAKTKTYQKRKQFLLEKKQKKGTKSNVTDADGNTTTNTKHEPITKEHIPFGEVVQEPPRISVIPKEIFKKRI